eukprot:5264445-Pleurochrysis_carterae.AAC.2
MIAVLVMMKLVVRIVPRQIRRIAACSRSCALMSDRCSHTSSSCYRTRSARTCSARPPTFSQQARPTPCQHAIRSLGVGTPAALKAQRAAYTRVKGCASPATEAPRLHEAREAA